MPQLPQFNRGQSSTPTAKGGERLWNIRYDTGEDMIAREVGKSAQLLGKVNQQMIRAEEESNIISAKAKLTELSQTAESQLESMREDEIGNFNKETGSVQLSEQAEKTIRSLSENLATEGLGGTEIENMAAQQEAELRAYARNAFRQKKASRVGAEMQQAYETALKNSRPTDAFEAIDKALDVGAINPGQAEEMKQQIWPNAEFYLAQQYLTKTENGKVSDIKKNPEVLGMFAPAGHGWEGHFEDGKLEMDADQWGDLQRIQDQIRTEREEQLAEIQDENADKLWLQRQEGSLTVGQVEQALRDDLISRSFADSMVKDLKRTKEKAPDPEQFTTELELKQDIQDVTPGDKKRLEELKTKIIEYRANGGDQTEARQMFDDLLKQEEQRQEIEELSEHQKNVLDDGIGQLDEMWNEANRATKESSRPFQFSFIPPEKLEGKTEEEQRKIIRKTFEQREAEGLRMRQGVAGLDISGVPFHAGNPWENQAINRRQYQALKDAMIWKVKQSPDMSRHEFTTYLDELLHPSKVDLAQMKLLERIESVQERVIREEIRAREDVIQKAKPDYDNVSDDKLREIFNRLEEVLETLD